MATLGKVLLFVNLLAAGGLIYVATEDWAKRQGVTAAAVRLTLILKGLPTDAPPADPAADGVPLGVETSGGYVVQAVRPALLDAHFQGADGGERFGGGARVASVVEEVKRAQGKADAALASVDDLGKLALLCGQAAAGGDFQPGVLVRAAETFEERDYYRRLATPPEGEAAKAAAAAGRALTRRFEAVLNKPDPKGAGEQAAKVQAAVEEVRKAAGGKDKSARDAAAAALAAALDPADRSPAVARDEADRRRRAAHLLAHLDAVSAPWQKRVALVVGLGEYRATLAAQADRLADMARTAQRMIEIDQARFTDEYEQQKQLAQDRFQLLVRQQKVTDDLKAQAVRDAEAVARRTTELDERRQDLKAVRAEVDKSLAAQAAVEKTVFDLQKRVGAALDDLVAKEAELLKQDERQTVGRPGPEQRGDTR